MDTSHVPEHELDSRHINAPVWPWTVAGFTTAAFFVAFFIIAWSHSL